MKKKREAIPISSKFVDKTAIMQVIGSVFNNPSLLENEEYSITENDFNDDFHKILYGAIYKLYNLGSNKISLENITDFLSLRPKSESVFKANGGEEYLVKISSLATQDTFIYYYNRLKKFSLLRAYDNLGVDLSFVYDINNIFDSKKKQSQEEWLDSCSIEDIINLVDERLDKIKIDHLDHDNLALSYHAGEGIEELIDRYKEEPEIGIPLYGDLINTITRGARLKKFYLRSAPSGIGKAIPNDTLIPTPKGFKRVDEIKPGDYLFGQDGKPTKVLQIHPQSKPKQVYNLTLADGRVARCCEDHLWAYQYKGHGVYSTRVEDTKTILARTNKLKNGFRNSDDKGYRFRIPINKPVEYKEQTFKIPPYVFGLLLGDGSFRYNKSQKALSFSSDNEELPSAIAKMCNWDYKKNSDFNCSYTFKYKDNSMNHSSVWVEEALEDFPDLWNVLSQSKFIPIEYLHGSIEQRYDLLAGLLDTDGSIEKKKGRISFTNTSLELINNVVELCHSLGLIVSVGEDCRPDKYTDKCWNIHIQCKKELKPRLFKLSRKLNIAKEYANNGKRAESKDSLSIVSITPTDEYVNMTCFTVDNDSHLFLMNDFIVTHNTRTMAADACNIACSKIYDVDFKWIKNGTSEPVLFISTELELEEVQTMMLAFLSNVDEEHILNGKYDEGEEERVKMAGKIIKESPLYVEILPDFSLQDIEKLIKKHIRKHNTKFIFYDYLHSSMKILEEITRRAGGVKLREDNILFMLSIRLKDLCNQYGIFIMSGTQLNGDWKTEKIPDQNLLRGAKAIADKADYGSIMLPVRDSDLDNLNSILKTNTFPNPNLKISVYKNRRGKYKGIYIWCQANLGTCRVQPLFCTDFSYEFKSIDSLKIIVKEDEDK